MSRTAFATTVAAVAFLFSGCALQENNKEQKPTSTQTGGQQGHGVLVVNLDGSDANKTPDHTITVPKVALKRSDDATDTGSKDETPKGVTPAQAKDNQEAQHKSALKDLLPLNLPFAAPSQPGCRTDFVRNYSSRNGVAPHDMAMHWTGSENVKGWSDVLGIVAWFDQARSQASSNYVVDAEGHCAYVVPEQQKAWTQAANNPFAISFEIVHPGGPNEPFCPGPCRRKVGMVMAAISKRWGIPLRHGATRNCVPTRSGVIDHKSLGVCGGGHPDVGGFSLDPLIAAAKAAAGKPAAKRYKPSATDRVTCRKVNWWRAHGRHHGKAERNAVRRRKALARRGVVCTRRGPLKTR